MSFFEFSTNTNGLRQGKLHFKHGSIKTPTFMPVGTRGAVKGLTPDQVRTTGAGIVLGNTYHLHLTVGEQIVEAAGGLAEYTKWHGPMLTDSGGFQVFSLGKIRKITEEGVTFKNPLNGAEVFISPEISMQIQHKLGADIIMAFDDVIDLSYERARAREALERTHRWLERCVIEHKKLSQSKENPPKLFGIFQGGLDKDLRLESLNFIASQEVDGIAIGGLSVGESREEMHEMLAWLADKYPSDKRPRYLMGVGHPVDLRFAFEHGIDMADCVLPTRNGRHGAVWLEGDQQVNLTNAKFIQDFSPIQVGCNCYACRSGFSRAWFRHQFKVGESLAGSLASLHNIYYLMDLCRSYQN